MKRIIYCGFLLLFYHLHPFEKPIDIQHARILKEQAERAHEQKQEELKIQEQKEQIAREQKKQIAREAQEELNLLKEQEKEFNSGNVSAAAELWQKAKPKMLTEIERLTKERDEALFESDKKAYQENIDYLKQEIIKNDERAELINTRRIKIKNEINEAQIQFDNATKESEKSDSERLKKELASEQERIEFYTNEIIRLQRELGSTFVKPSPAILEQPSWLTKITIKVKSVWANVAEFFGATGKATQIRTALKSKLIDPLDRAKNNRKIAQFASDAKDQLKLHYEALDELKKAYQSASTNDAALKQKIEAEIVSTVQDLVVIREKLFETWNDVEKGLSYELIKGIDDTLTAIGYDEKIRQGFLEVMDIESIRSSLAQQDWVTYGNKVRAMIERTPAKPAEGALTRSEIVINEVGAVLALHDYHNYPAQQQALFELQKVFADSSMGIDQKIKDEIQRRIAQISQFKAQEGPNNNSLDIKLELRKKIPSDQVASLNLAYTQELNSKSSTKVDVSLFEQGLEAIKHYKLSADYPLIEQMYQAAFDKYKPQKTVPETLEKPTAEIAQNPAIREAGDPEKIQASLFEGGNSAQAIPAINTVVTFLKSSYAAVVNGFVYARAQAADFLIARFAKNAVEIGKKMQIIKRGSAWVAEKIDVIRANEKFLKFKKVMNWLPGEKPKQILEGIEKALDKVKDATTKGSLVAILTYVVDAPGKLVEGLGTLGTKIGEQLETADQVVLRRVEARIAQERLLLVDREKEIKQETNEISSSGIFKEVRDWFRDNFQNYEKDMNKYEKKYNAVVAKYRTELEKFGLTKDATYEQIQEKLQDMKKNGQLKELRSVTNDLADVLKDLSESTQKYMDSLDGIMSNFEFLVKAWDDVRLDGNPDVVTVIDGFFRLRDTKIAFYQAARKEVVQLRADSEALHKNSTFLNRKEFQQLDDTFIERLASLIDTKEVELITNYAKELDPINKILSEAKERLDKEIGILRQKTEQAPDLITVGG